MLAPSFSHSSELFIDLRSILDLFLGSSKLGNLLDRLLSSYTGCVRGCKNTTRIVVP